MSLWLKDESLLVTQTLPRAEVAHTPLLLTHPHRPPLPFPRRSARRRPASATESGGATVPKQARDLSASADRVAPPDLEARNGCGCSLHSATSGPVEVRRLDGPLADRAAGPPTEPDRQRRAAFAITLARLAAIAPIARAAPAKSTAGPVQLPSRISCGGATGTEGDDPDCGAAVAEKVRAPAGPEALEATAKFAAVCSANSATGSGV